MRTNAVAAVPAGSLVWLGLVIARLRSVEETLWVARDDAVITLSHARNAALHGSIGVSPGDRVEAFSSPLHFLLSYLIQLVADPGYRSITMTILIVMSLLSGAASVVILRSVAHKHGLSGPVADLFAVGLTAVAGVWVVASWTSVGWLGSGMENPAVVATGLVSVALALRASPRRFSQVILVVALASFALARVEFAAFAMPFVTAAAWSFAQGVALPRRRRLFIETAGVATLLIVLVHVARRLYFGDWLPHTAVVQGRADGLNRFIAIAFIGMVLTLAVSVGALTSGSITVPNHRKNLVRDVRILGLVLLGVLILLSGLNMTGGNVVFLPGLPPVLPLVLLIGALFLVDMAWAAKPSFTDALFLALAAIPLAQFVALGQARLDPFRVAAIAVPFLAVWASSLLLRLVIRIRTDDSAPFPILERRGLASAGLVVLLLAGWGITAATDGSRRLNWEVGSARSLTATVEEYRSERLDDGLAILANPDLGKVSFEKNSLMVDLGFLADPLLNDLFTYRFDLVPMYLQHVAAPDVVSVHGAWSCPYATWLESEEFAAAYVPDDPSALDQPAANDCAFGGRRIVWLRSGAAAETEHELTRLLVNSGDPVAAVRDALAECAASGSDHFRCQPARRALQRASVHLRQSGTYAAAVDEFAISPSAAFDRAMLLREAGWSDDAFDALLSLSAAT